MTRTRRISTIAAQHAGTALKIAVTLSIVGSLWHLTSQWSNPIPIVAKPIWVVLGIVAVVFLRHQGRLLRHSPWLGSQALARHELWQAAVLLMAISCMLNAALGTPKAHALRWLKDVRQTWEVESRRDVARAEAATSKAKADLARQRARVTPSDSDDLPAGDKAGDHQQGVRKPANHDAGKADGRSISNGKGTGSEASDGPAPINRDVEEVVNRWGTLFAWLIAVLAVVLALVSSWIIGLLKDAQAQVAQARASMDLDRRQERLWRSMQVHAAMLAVQRRLTVADSEDVDSQFLRRLNEVLARMVEVQRTDSDRKFHTPQFLQARLSLESMRKALRNPEDMRLLVRNDVLPALTSVLDVVRTSDQMQDDVGRSLAEAMGDLARFFDRF